MEISSTVDENRKFQMLHVKKERLPAQNYFPSVQFIKCSDMIWNKSNGN